MPFVQVNIFEGRSAEQKEAAIEKITDALVDSLGAKKEAVRVLIQEHPKENWGIGGQTAEKLGR